MNRPVPLLVLMFLVSLPVVWAQPAKGDAPEKVYQMYLDALHRDDVAVAYACSAEKPGQSEKTLRHYLSFLQLAAPRRFTVREKFFDRDTCILKLRAFFTLPGAGNLKPTDNHDPGKGACFTVTLVKEKDIWKVAEEEMGLDQFGRKGHHHQRGYERPR